MARNINDIVLFIRYVIRKERGVFQTDAQITANLDTAQLDCFEEWFVSYGASQEIHDALRPFRVPYQFTTDAAGFVTFPSGYLHLIGTPYTVTGSTVNEVRFYNEDEFPRALKSQLRPVSLSTPIAKDTATGFSIYPQSTQIGFFTYLRRPNAPVYGTTVVGRVVTYDPNTSVQLEWSDAYINKIIAISLKFAGINMDEDKIYQFAEQYQKET